MDNFSIARIFREIADLLEIKGENPFKVRAYRGAADTVADCPESVANLSEDNRRRLPGIGRDLAGKLAELVETGALAYHRDLLAEFPPSILDILKLQGVGPKTVALLYRELNIRTLDDLESAARAGRLRAIKGMGAKKEALMLKSIAERKQAQGRRLTAEAHDVAAVLVAALRTGAPDATILPVGSLRRGCETCGDLDILAAGADATLMDVFARHALVERVLGRGETKSSVLLRGGFQADLRAVPRESAGAAMQYFTGSKAHNIALRDRAIQRGLKLNEYGLFDLATGMRVAGAAEEEIYEALGLAWVPPELRENRGEIAAAEARALPELIELADIRGDLHMHTTRTDGRADAGSMARAARELGREYIAITEHSKALAMANGLDERAALEHAARVRALNGRVDGLTVLAGIECDILPDGRLDLSDDCLAQLDYVVASAHSGFGQGESEMTERLLRALSCPWVDALGHPTGRLLLRREGYPFRLEQVVTEAARLGVALEINCQIDRLDLNDVNARLARERGARLVISTDAHAPSALGWMRWGVTVARRAWLRRSDVLNTMPLDAFRASLRRSRPRP
ncbi:MAG: DNA polymerase/3'-5' exonuclease PolX [Acidobacteria bacterium]|nr:DNA polymerase/3'-5' exonuclease PolX [Acidobacteriota bacterium]